MENEWERIWKMKCSIPTRCRLSYEAGIRIGQKGKRKAVDIATCTHYKAGLSDGSSRLSRKEKFELNGSFNRIPEIIKQARQKTLEEVLEWAESYFHKSERMTKPQWEEFVEMIDELKNKDR